MKIKGIAASPGWVMGNFMVVEEMVHPDYTQLMINASQVDLELKKLEEALDESERQMMKIKEKASSEGKTEQADIMAAHMMMLRDPMLTDGFVEAIQKNLICAAGAVQGEILKQKMVFESLEDPYFKERAHDIQDIGQRITNNLLQIPMLDLSCLESKVILVAHDLPPSVMATVDQEKLMGIVAEIGGKTSHTAILANNMGVPAILGCTGILEIVKGLNTKDSIAIDGIKGEVHLNLSAEDVDQIQKEMSRQVEEKQLLDPYKNQSTKTQEGYSIELAANVMNPSEVEKVLSVGAEGVGLYRTEFLFMDRDSAPQEEEQFQAYKTVVEGLKGKPVIIRTLDIGGDKAVDYLHLEKEENPFLGFRAIRICFERTEIFMTQLRAILRASAFGNTRIMFPMICSLEELRMAKSFVEKAKDELRSEGKAFDENLPVGIMIEIPSAALIADLLIEECDFFSIGSNDLTQYTLAVDRMNEKISLLYNSYHPAMLRMIKNVAEAAEGFGHAKFAGMCGEMAGDPLATKLLVGLGITELSMSPSKILRVRSIINEMNLKQAQEIARFALTLKTAVEVEAYLKSCN